MQRTQLAFAVATCLLIGHLNGAGAGAQTTLRLMGWNLRGSTFNQAASSIIAYLLDSGADVIALQEVGNAVDSLMADPALGSQYEFFQTSNDNPFLGQELALPGGVGRSAERRRPVQ